MTPLWRELRARALAESWELRWPLRYGPGRIRSGWEHRRACEGLPIDMFFEQQNQSVAVAVCETCPVRVDCLRDAFVIESQIDLRGVDGVRGGLLQSQRRDLLSARRRAAREAVSAA